MFTPRIPVVSVLRDSWWSKALGEAAAHHTTKFSWWSGWTKMHLTNTQTKQPLEGLMSDHTIDESISGETWLWLEMQNMSPRTMFIYHIFPNTFLKFNMDIQNCHVWKEMPFQITIFSIHIWISGVSLFSLLCPRRSFSPSRYASDWCSTCGKGRRES